MRIRLLVAISTTGAAGIERVASMQLPRANGVAYAVSWQQSGNTAVPEVLSSRADVMEIDRTPTVGLSNNRNNAIDIWRRLFPDDDFPWMLIADDDLIYKPYGLLEAIERLEKDKELDFASFRHEGCGAECFPDKEFDLTRRHPRGYFVTSFDIALHCRDVRFDPAFGLAAPRYTMGEETLLFHDLKAAGKRGRYFPVTICRHDHRSTGYRPLTPGQLEALGIVVRVQHPLTSILRLPIIAWRRHRSDGVSLLHCLKHLFKGYLTKRPNETPRDI